MTKKFTPLVTFVAGVVAAGALTGIPGSAATDGNRPERTTEWLTAKVGDALGRKGVVTWVPTGSFASSADVRVPRYPFAIDGRDTRELKLDAVRNEQVSAQLAIAASESLDDLSASVTDLAGPGGARLSSRTAGVRFVQYVPVMRSKSEMDWSATIDQVSSAREVSGDRNPDVVGDPLLEARSVDVPAYAAQPLWFTFGIPRDTPPGIYSGQVAVRANGKAQATYPLTIEVANAAVPDPKDYGFALDVWLQPETIAQAHHVPMWSRRHWELIETYQRDLVRSGQRLINTTVVDNPWHHQWSLGTRRPQTYLPYESMVGWTWDGAAFTFDFARFDKFVETARRAGAGPEIGAYSMLAFQDAEHITYTDARTGKQVYENVELGGPRWRQAWQAFLDSFQSHLEKRGWLGDTWLSFDERPIETMTVVRDFVHEVAPVFDQRIAVAGSLSTKDIASNLSVDWGGIDQVTPELVHRRRAEGKTTTFYVYGLPAHPNTLSYSPAVESRMLPWIAASKELDGFLRWAYNSWPEDVFNDPVFIFSQGDEYMVYPGANGPMSSIRWEQLREGIEDFELVGQLRARQPENEVLKQALVLATRNLDGRVKDPQDMAMARSSVVGELSR